MSEEIDPVFRCCGCQKLVKRTTLHKLGICSNCGNRRVSALTVLNTGEKKKLIEWGFEDFAIQFEPVEGAE